MNRNPKNLQEINKFEAWKRQQIINEIFRASFPRIAAAGLGRAAKRLGSGLIGAVSVAPKYVTKTAKAMGDVQQKTKVLGTQITPRYTAWVKAGKPDSGRPFGRREIRQFKRTQRDIRNQSFKVDSVSKKQIIKAKSSIGLGIQGAKSAISAVDRAFDIKMPKPVVAAKNILTTIPRIVTGAAIENIKQNILSYDPDLTSAQNKRLPHRSSLGGELIGQTRKTIKRLNK